MKLRGSSRRLGAVCSGTSRRCWTSTSKGLRRRPVRLRTCTRAHHPASAQSLGLPRRQRRHVCHMARCAHRTLQDAQRQRANHHISGVRAAVGATDMHPRGGRPVDFRDNLVEPHTLLHRQGELFDQRRISADEDPVAARESSVRASLAAICEQNGMLWGAALGPRASLSGNARGVSSWHFGATLQSRSLSFAGRPHHY